MVSIATRWGISCDVGDYSATTVCAVIVTYEPELQSLQSLVRAVELQVGAEGAEMLRMDQAWRSIACFPRTDPSNRADHGLRRNTGVVQSR